MPFQSDYDKAAIRELAAEFEVDYVALTYTCSAQDVSDLRGFLDSSGLQHTAIMAKVGGPERKVHGGVLCGGMHPAELCPVFLGLGPAALVNEPGLLGCAAPCSRSLPALLGNDRHVAVGRCTAL